MAKYFVKLIMSEEYIIAAETKEDAEKQAREKFGCDYYIDDVEVTEVKEQFDRGKSYMNFREKLNKAYQESNLFDTLINVLEEDDLVEFSSWLDNEASIDADTNYELYNKAFENIYGHPAFDEDENVYDKNKMVESMRLW